MSVYILDENLRLASIGARGMIWVAGRQLSCGYFGRPDLTATAFRQNPFRQGLMYRTGMYLE